MIETVLTELIGEMKQSNELLKENSRITTENKNRLIALEKNLVSKDSKTSIDTRPIEQIVSKGVQSMSAMVNAYSEKRSREFRILLFPEHNTKEYYRVVFGKVIFLLVILVIAKYVYLLGSEWIAKSSENQKCKKAWNSLYQQQPKTNQKIMQKIMDNQ